MLVAQIADNYLHDTHRVAERNKFNDLVEVFNPFTDGKSATFAEAAVWADDIKNYGAKMFDNYHFTNMYTLNQSVLMTQTLPSTA